MVMVLKWEIWLSAELERSNDSVRSGFSLTRDSLAKLRLKARRCGAWFRNLKQNERKLLDLTISVVERVRSFLLAKLVSQLVSRLFEAMESRISRLIRTEGKEMAHRLSEIAICLGYKTAKCWANDRGLMQYLTINSLESLRVT
jgi:hypothetical protein